MACGGETEVRGREKKLDDKLDNDFFFFKKIYLFPVRFDWIMSYLHT